MANDWLQHEMHGAPLLYEYEMGRRVSSNVYMQHNIVDPKDFGVPFEKTMMVDQLEMRV